MSGKNLKEQLILNTMHKMMYGMVNRGEEMMLEGNLKIGLVGMTMEMVLMTMDLKQFQMDLEML
jgi:hypothetical protein